MLLVTPKTERKFAIIFKLYKRSYFTYFLICTLVHRGGSTKVLRRNLVKELHDSLLKKKSKKKKKKMLIIGGEELFPRF